MLPLGVTILHGISLFHVSGHVWECFFQFSPTFIPGAGQVDGQILESLWSVLNEISPSRQNATLAGQVEMLDDHMGDLNFKKMLDIGGCRYPHMGIAETVISRYHQLPIQSCPSR